MTTAAEDELKRLRSRVDELETALSEKHKILFDTLGVLERAEAELTETKGVCDEWAYNYDELEKERVVALTRVEHAESRLAEAMNVIASLRNSLRYGSDVNVEIGVLRRALDAFNAHEKDLADAAAIRERTGPQLASIRKQIDDAAKDARELLDRCETCNGTGQVVDFCGSCTSTCPDCKGHKTRTMYNTARLVHRQQNNALLCRLGHVGFFEHALIPRAPDEWWRHLIDRAQRFAEERIAVTDWELNIYLRSITEEFMP